MRFARGGASGTPLGLSNAQVADVDADGPLWRYVERAVEIVARADSPDDAVTGAAYMLVSPACLKILLRRWPVAARFMRALVDSYHQDRPTVQLRLLNLFTS